jgi:DNA recombination protein RmuC
MTTTILLSITILLLLINLLLTFQARAAKSDASFQHILFQMQSLNTEIKRIEAAVKTEIATNRGEASEASKNARTELSHSLKDNRMELRLAIEQMRATLEKKMSELQAGNEKKLDEMRTTVDEKLQKTLETRLGESFKLVSERLEAVHKGLGDMQQLATGVGDLKKVLTNVKTRGLLGEYQLENILEQMLTPEQYGKNVKTKEGANTIVEFAVKLPGKEDRDQSVWLPIDSKFPKEDFESLLQAYDDALPDTIEACRANFVKGIKKCAADISTRYIDPPNTTDFAILFLPFESLYAEVLRTPGLFESIQRECKIIITGPTTLSALLSSLQMGFRTLAIERRSSEVWQLLGAVKTEFSLFGGILEKTQKKLQEASNVIEQAGVRSRVIERKLKTVQELPKDEAIQLIGDGNG